MNFAKLGGRRFLLAAGAGVVCTILVWFSKISDTVFGTVVVATVAAYITGNVAEAHVTRGASSDASSK